MTTHWLDRPRNGLALSLALVGIGGAWQFNSQISELNRDALNKDRELNLVHAEMAELRSKLNCGRLHE